MNTKDVEKMLQEKYPDRTLTREWESHNIWWSDAATGESVCCFNTRTGYVTLYQE